MVPSPTPSPTFAPVPRSHTSSAARSNGSARQAVSPPLPPTTSSDDARRPAIQFLPNPQVGLSTSDQKRGPRKGQRRLSSPPPPPVFRPRVSFDTFEKPADFIEENSFTLIAKHKDYEYTRRSRTFLCGLDSNDYSEYALEWLIDELVDDGDEIVCLRVVEKDSTLAADPSVEKGRYRAEAEQLMKHIQARNSDNKAINLILEFSVGKVNKVIEEMINLYEPAILVVGTRGRSLGGFQGLLPGSVSKYCLQHSPVPVIVVRPNSKRAKAKRKRVLDPTRHNYKDILDKSGPHGGHVLDINSRNSLLLDESIPASEDEAAAVAAAIGYKPAPDAHPLAQVQSALQVVEPESPEMTYSDTTEAPPSPDDMRSPAVLMKSPELENLDSPIISPVVSDSSSDEDADDNGGVSTGSSAAVRAEDRKRAFEQGLGSSHSSTGSDPVGETLSPQVESITLTDASPVKAEVRNEDKEDA